MLARFWQNCIQSNIQMKNFLKYSWIILIFFLSSFVTIDDVIRAIKSSDAKQLSKFFDDTIEITLPEKSNTYSKSQAELVLKDFFTNNVIIDFEKIHKGENAGSQFIVGRLTTKNGNYRTTIYMKQKGDKQLLQELRFEK